MVLTARYLGFGRDDVDRVMDETTASRLIAQVNAFSPSTIPRRSCGLDGKTILLRSREHGTRFPCCGGTSFQGVARAAASHRRTL